MHAISITSVAIVAFITGMIVGGMAAVLLVRLVIMAFGG